MTEPTPRALDLGRLVRQHRTDMGLSLEEVARRSGLDRSSINRLERGLFAAPSPQTLQRLARALNADAEDYFGLIGYFTPQGLPSLQPYLRSKYDATPEEAREVDRYFSYLRERDENRPPQQANDRDAA